MKEDKIKHTDNKVGVRKIKMHKNEIIDKLNKNRAKNISTIGIKMR